MWMADGGGGAAGFIRDASDEAVKTGKAVAGDIGFDAAGFDKVIHRLEDVIDAQMNHKRASQRRERSSRGDFRKSEDDPMSGYYSQSADHFDEKYEEWSDKYVKRLRETVEKFQKVKAHYMAREDEIGEQFRSGMKK